MTEPHREVPAARVWWAPAIFPPLLCADGFGKGDAWHRTGFLLGETVTWFEETEWGEGHMRHTVLLLSAVLEPAQ